MDLEPQDGRATRSRWRTLIALTLVAGCLGARAARADITVHFMNCTSDSVEAQAFDAKDSVEEVAASTAKLNQSGQSQSLHCAGQGKGYCQVIVTVLDKPVVCSNTNSSSGIGGHVGFHLDSGKWAVVTGFTVDGSTCKPVVSVNLDSAPSSCN